MASSLAELQSEIEAEMAAAMDEAAEKMFDIVESEVAGYYTGTPKRYTRTGQMLSTPTLSPMSGGGSSLSFRVYLNPAGGYSTGCQPSMLTVLNWTNSGGGGTIGHHGYWNRAESKMAGAFLMAFNSHFG